MKMKKYFKPHIIQLNNGMYVIRKYVLFKGWRFMDTADNRFWWISIGWFCFFKTLEEAQEKLSEYKRRRK